MTDQANDVFNRERQPFKIGGKEFYYEFIPSYHFQVVLSEVLAVFCEFDMVGTEIVPKKNINMPKLLEQVGGLLRHKVYEILFDVLMYQNDCTEYSIDRLKKQTRPMEIADFLAIVVADDEILRAMTKVANGLGKLITGMIPPEAATEETKENP